MFFHSFVCHLKHKSLETNVKDSDNNHYNYYYNYSPKTYFSLKKNEILKIL